MVRKLLKRLAIALSISLACAAWGASQSADAATADTAAASSYAGKAAFTQPRKTYTVKTKAAFRKAVRDSVRVLSSTSTLNMSKGLYSQKLLDDTIEDLLKERVFFERYDGCRYYLSYDKRVLKISFIYRMKPSKIQADSIKAGMNADAVISEIIDDGMSEYDKVMAVNDYLADATYYDKAELASPSITDPYNYMSTGPLLKGKAVCSGYAAAASLLLDRMKIPNMIVSGTGKSSTSGSQPHAWLLVRLSNGSYYHLDVTWNDTESKHRSYGYLLLDDEAMDDDHIWDSKEYPKAADPALDYYAINGTLMETKGEFLNFVDSSLGKGSAELVFKGVGIDAAWFGSEFKSIVGKHFNGYRYSYVMYGAVTILSITGDMW